LNTKKDQESTTPFFKGRFTKSKNLLQ